MFKSFSIACLLCISFCFAQNTPGWSSLTGFRSPNTSVQQNIVTVAKAAHGSSSGASKIKLPNGATAPWLTDIASSDGTRMRAAINRYDVWYRSNPKNMTLLQVKNLMKGDFSTSGYGSTQKTALVDKIVAKYNSLATYSCVAVPSDDQSTLVFMDIRKQCLEWVATLSFNAGGKAKGYSSSPVPNQANFRPGMGLYKTDHSHAMIIIDIYWNSTGGVVKYKVAEANNGTGWVNPPGMIPWLRTVSATREVIPSSSLKVVNLEY